MKLPLCGCFKSFITMTPISNWSVGQRTATVHAAAFADDLALGVAPWVATAGAGVSVNSCCTACCSCIGSSIGCCSYNCRAAVNRSSLLFARAGSTWFIGHVGISPKHATSTQQQHPQQYSWKWRSAAAAKQVHKTAFCLIIMMIPPNQSLLLLSDHVVTRMLAVTTVTG